ncbi:MAG: hypothetical protein ACE366_11260 [Bradymonadia bacterium]
MVNQGLTEVSTEALKTVLKALHHDQLPCPVGPAGIAALGLQYTDGPLLNALRGLDTRGVRAVIVSVLAERLKFERRLNQGR